MAESTVFFLLEKLAPLLQEQVTLLSGVREEVEYIRDELERMTAFLRVADSTEENDPEVQVWVKQVRDVVYDTEDVLDLFMFRMAHRHYGNGLYGSFRGFLRTIKNLKARSEIASKIQSIKARVTKIAEGHQRYRFKFNVSEQQQGSATTSTVVNNTWYDPRGDALFLEEADLVGIDKSKKQLIPWLVEGDSGLKVVSIVGLGGLGKTTLVKKVYDDATVEQHFQIHAWISVSESFRVESLLKGMITQLFKEIRQPIPQEFATMTINDLKWQIKQFLQQKRYLVVFDDVWKIDAWESIKHVLPDNSCGSRVMLTTRKADVATTCCVETNGNVFHLEPLTVEESWTLFCSKAFHKNPCPPHLEEVCKSILHRCEGLPLAIVTICGILARKDKSRVDEWQMFYQSLGSELEGNNKLERVRKLLSLSYYDLPHYLKICFLYLSIFPEDYEIERLRVVRLWTAEGFIQMKEGMTVEEIAEGYLNELVERSLVQVSIPKLDGRIRRCRVHDLLREIIISKSREQNIVAIYSHGNARLREKVRRLSIYHTMSDSIQGSEHFSQLRSLLMFGVEHPPSVLHNGGLRLLKVLDLRGANLETFPEAIVRLFNLRYLSLRETKVKVLPESIRNLENLECLDLKRTLVTDFPDGILKLQKLKHLLAYQYKHNPLTLGDDICGFRAPANIGGLTSLQRLCYIDADRGNNEVIEIGKLTELRTLAITNFRREDGMAMCSSLSKLSNLRALYLRSTNEGGIIDLPHPVSSVPRFLQKLHLIGRLEKLPHWVPSHHGLIRVELRESRLSVDPLPLLEDLPNLLALVFNRAYEWKGLCFKDGRFPRLKKLLLMNLEGLRWVRLEQGAMPHLEELEISGCELLEEVPSGIEHLTDLKLVVFHKVPDELIRSIDRNEEFGVGVDYWRVAHIPKVWVGSDTDYEARTKTVRFGYDKIRIVRRPDST